MELSPELNDKMSVIISVTCFDPNCGHHYGSCLGMELVRTFSCTGSKKGFYDPCKRGMVIIRVVIGKKLATFFQVYKVPSHLGVNSDWLLNRGTDRAPSDDAEDISRIEPRRKDDLLKFLHTTHLFRKPIENEVLHGSIICYDVTRPDHINFLKLERYLGLLNSFVALKRSEGYQNASMRIVIVGNTYWTEGKQRRPLVVALVNKMQEEVQQWGQRFPNLRLHHVLAGHRTGYHVDDLFMGFLTRIFPHSASITIQGWKLFLSENINDIHDLDFWISHAWNPNILYRNPFVITMFFMRTCLYQHWESAVGTSFQDALHEFQVKSAQHASTRISEILRFVQDETEDVFKDLEILEWILDLPMSLEDELKTSTKDFVKKAIVRNWATLFPAEEMGPIDVAMVPWRLFSWKLCVTKTARSPPIDDAHHLLTWTITTLIENMYMHWKDLWKSRGGRLNMDDIITKILVSRMNAIQHLIALTIERYLASFLPEGWQLFRCQETFNCSPRFLAMQWRLVRKPGFRQAPFYIIINFTKESSPTTENMGLSLTIEVELACPDCLAGENPSQFKRIKFQPCIVLKERKQPLLVVVGQSRVHPMNDSRTLTELFLMIGRLQLLMHYHDRVMTHAFGGNDSSGSSTVPVNLIIDSAIQKQFATNFGKKCQHFSWIIEDAGTDE